jgi:hypothetical protein
MAVSRFTTVAAAALLSSVAGLAHAAPPSQGAIDNLTQRMFGVIDHVELTPATTEWFLRWLAHATENPTNQMDLCGVEFWYSKAFDGSQCQKYFAGHARVPTCLNCSSNGQ